MSKIAEYKQLEAQLAAQLAALDDLKNDSGLKREIEFESKLKALMAEYGYSLKSLIGLLDPKAAGVSVATKGQRKERSLKTYKNPQSGEIIETKGGNHRVLKAWKAEHGSDVVESWLQK